MSKSDGKKGSAASSVPVLSVKKEPGESDREAMARLVITPSGNAVSAIRAYQLLADPSAVDLTELVRELDRQSKAASSGDLSRPEAMLTAQAHTLDAVFAHLLRRASMNLGEYRDSAEVYLKLAFRAQSQCRATLETLAGIKNPPVVIAKQANIAHGPQQVNNEVNATHARASEIQSEPSKLLEQSDGERLDTRATGEAINGDPAMATVGKIHGAKVRGG